MTAIFTSVPGRVVLAVESNEAQSFTLSVEDEASGDTFENSGFTTSFQLTQKVSAQFQISLDRSLFAIPFGDDVGMMSVGLVHGLFCDGEGGDTEIDTAQAIQDWYRRNKFQASRLDPIRLTVGESGYAGYVISMDLSAEAAQGSMVRSRLQLAAWSLP